MALRMHSLDTQTYVRRRLLPLSVSQRNWIHRNRPQDWSDYFFLAVFLISTTVRPFELKLETEGSKGAYTYLAVNSA